jgi:ankyrin repeat protein
MHQNEPNADAAIIITSALFTACSSGELDTVKLLLEYRKSDGGGSDDGQTPLVDVNTTTPVRGSISTALYGTYPIEPKNV